jgi:hypothetical protein
MPKLPPGQVELKILFSVNSQQFIDSGKKILFNNPEPGLSYDDLMKLEEADKKIKPKSRQPNK